MMKTMEAAVLYGKRDVRMERVPRPVAGRGQVLVKIKAVGICGSDVHYYQEFGMGENYRLTQPQILGHEASGMVVETGEDITGFQPGDRVTIEPGETCMRCTQCKTGHYNLCPDVHFLSTPFEKGAFAEYLAMRADMLYMIPDDMSYEVASLAEPLSVGIHACEMSLVRPGVKLLILGAGPIGLMALIAARAFGATDITICDIQDNRLEFAKTVCKARNIANTKTMSARELVERYAGGIGFDCVIEAAGAPVTQHMTVEAARKGARIALVGIGGDEDVMVNTFDIIDKELTIRGVFRYANSYPAAVEILHSGIVDFEKIISKRFPLAQTGEALEYALTRKLDAIKTVVTDL